MSNHKFDYDTIVYKRYDLVYHKPISIEGRSFLGVQVYDLNKGIVEKQPIVSEIKIECNEKNISIPLDNHFLLFNANFCNENEYGLVKPVEIYEIGDNKLAIYFHGEPRYINQVQADYIAKVIVDKDRGYIGTISMSDFDLEAYGWRISKDFQGF